MASATFTSRDFNREPGRIKRAAAEGPVFITERHKPSLVVLAYKDYEMLTGKARSLLDALTPASPGDHDFAWEPAKAALAGRPADLGD